MLTVPHLADPGPERAFSNLVAVGALEGVAHLRICRHVLLNFLRAILAPENDFQGAPEPAEQRAVPRLDLLLVLLVGRDPELDIGLAGKTREIGRGDFRHGCALRNSRVAGGPDETIGKIARPARRPALRKRYRSGTCDATCGRIERSRRACLWPAPRSMRRPPPIVLEP
jgi:hypothetical protein